jgi:predicted transposase YdaD
MVVLRESPWYQQILKEGEIRGEIIGENRGIVSAIELSLEIKFGQEGLQLMPKISQISDLEQLKNIQRGIMTVNNVDELREFMQGIE